MFKVHALHMFYKVGWTLEKWGRSIAHNPKMFFRKRLPPSSPPLSIKAVCGGWLWVDGEVGPGYGLEPTA